MSKPTLIARAQRAYRKGGAWRLAKGLVEYTLFRLSENIHKLIDPVLIGIRRRLPSLKYFTFRRQRYQYFYHTYNTTWKNERAVEIPILKKILDGYDDSAILEFGNVWGRYFRHSHAVVDKYERWPGVINQDITDFNPRRRYQLIFGISTLEHVGFDENIRDPEKPLAAIRQLRSWLAPGGRLILTVPAGYNPFLDHLLDTGKVPFAKRYCLKRTSRWNDWDQTSWGEIRSMKYGRPYPWANGLTVLEFTSRQRS